MAWDIIWIQYLFLFFMIFFISQFLQFCKVQSLTHYGFCIHTDKFKWHQQDFPVSDPLEITFPRALILSHVLELSLLSKAESGGGLSWQITFWRALSKWQLVYSGSPVQLRPVSHTNEFQNGYCQDFIFVPNVVWASNHWTSHSYQIADVCRLNGETIYPL